MAGLDCTYKLQVRALDLLPCEGANLARANRLSSDPPPRGATMQRPKPHNYMQSAWFKVLATGAARGSASLQSVHC